MVGNEVKIKMKPVSEIVPHTTDDRVSQSDGCKDKRNDDIFQVRLQGKYTIFDYMFRITAKIHKREQSVATSHRERTHNHPTILLIWYYSEHSYAVLLSCAYNVK
jgi:hypothetical protein